MLGTVCVWNRVDVCLTGCVCVGMDGCQPGCVVCVYVCVSLAVSVCLSFRLYVCVSVCLLACPRPVVFQLLLSLMPMLSRLRPLAVRV